MQYVGGGVQKRGGRGGGRGGARGKAVIGIFVMDCYGLCVLL
jgi:hypothetical protein